MHTVWKRIDDWLTLHTPELGGLLQPGATDEEIQDAEAIMGVAFPEDIKASYRIHNGVRFSPLGSNFIAGRFALFSLKEMIETWEWWHRPGMNVIDYSEGDSEDDWRQYMSEATEEEDGDMCLEGYDAKLVALMSWPVGVLLCFDAAHTREKSFGQIIAFSPESGIHFVAPSFHAFLSSFADDLEAGKYLIEKLAGYTCLREPPPPPAET